MVKTTGNKKSNSRQNANLGSKSTAKATPAAGKLPTGGDKVVQCLEREGVEVVFGLPGGAAIPLFDALYESKIKLILTRHEQGATHMADGFARATGKPGVVVVTSGPGATNTVTGLLTALSDSVPMIVLCGQVIRPMLGKDGFQEADVTGITYAAVKHSYLVKDVADIPRIMKEAFFIASSGRPGPVLIDLPKDVLASPCAAPFVDKVELPGYHVPQHADASSLKQAAAFLAKQLGMIDDEQRRRMVSLIAKAGLPTNNLSLDTKAVVEAMAFDKKIAAGKVRFVLPTKIGAVVVRDDVARENVTEAVESLQGAGLGPRRG